MNLKEIKNKMKNAFPKPIDNDSIFSVLLPLIEIDGELNLIYEVRSKSIRQPGEISFPGGRVEDDESPEYAAIRETHEELGIDETNIEIISEMDYATSKGGSFVYTFLGYINNIDIKKINYNKEEVSELIFVPLSYFLENEPEEYFMNYFPQTDNDFPHHLVNNGKLYNWENLRYPVYFYKYKDYIIWGMTAKITYSLIKKIKKHK